MPKVLEFDPNRDLEFDANRKVEFDPNRKLEFDPGRNRGFEPGRDLGFGKRGPVFRGYVCPICGAQVTEDQPSCTECGAIFDPKGRGDKAPTRPPSQDHSMPRSPAAPEESVRSPPPPARAYPQPPKRVDSKFCIHCGARLASADTFCWQCGNNVGGK